jgi:hypothetical protein
MSKLYFIYTKSSGKILQTGVCEDKFFDEFVQEGQAILSGFARFNLDYVVDGQVVELPPRPNDYCVFDYDIKQWVDPRTPETQWPIVRAERNRRLQACDWTQLSDIPAETKTLWEPYRQELRDVTDQPDPFNIVWPTPPQ